MTGWSPGSTPSHSTIADWFDALQARPYDVVTAAALDAPGDDYVTKPFNVEELLARIGR